MFSRIVSLDFCCRAFQLEFVIRFLQGENSPPRETCLKTWRDKLRKLFYWPLFLAPRGGEATFLRLWMLLFLLFSSICGFQHSFRLSLLKMTRGNVVARKFFLVFCPSSHVVQCTCLPVMNSRKMNVKQTSLKIFSSKIWILRKVKRPSVFLKWHWILVAIIVQWKRLKSQQVLSWNSPRYLLFDMTIFFSWVHPLIGFCFIWTTWLRSTTLMSERAWKRTSSCRRRRRSSLLPIQRDLPSENGIEARRNQNFQSGSEIGGSGFNHWPICFSPNFEIKKEK